MKRFLSVIIAITLSVPALADTLLVDKLVFKGNKEIPSTVLEKDLISKRGTPYSMDSLAKDYEQLSENPYLESVSVYPNVVNGKVEVVVEVVEKRDIYTLLRGDGIYTNSDISNGRVPAIVKEIILQGNLNVSDEDVIKKLPFQVGGYYSIEKMELGKSNLMRTGMFRRISYTSIKEGKHVFVTFHLDENNFIGSNIKFKGSSLFKDAELRELIDTKPDTLLNTKEINKDREKIMKKYDEKDYLNVEVGIGFEGGNNLVFDIVEPIVGEVRFEKQSHTGKVSLSLYTKDDILRRLVTLEKGKPLKKSDLMNTRRRILRLGYFSNIVPDIKQSKEGDNIRDIVFKLTEDKIGIQLHGGLKGSVEELMFDFSADHNNFLGRSQRFKISLQYQSAKRWKGTLSFFDPWVSGTNRMSMGLDLFRMSSGPDGSTVTYTEYCSNDMFTGVAGTVGFPLIGDELRINFRNSLKVVTHFDLSDVLLDTYLENSFSASVSYDSRDDIRDPSNGIFATIKGTWDKRFKHPSYNYTNFDKKPDIISGDIESMFYSEFLSPINVVAARVSMGAAKYLGLEDNPPFSRFALGGVSTLRGYDSRSVRGTKYMMLNLEDRIALYDQGIKVEMAFFFDMGYATKKGLDDLISLGNWKKSIGIGFRLKNFFIPIMLDFSLPLDEEDKYIRTEFGFGTSF